MKNAISKNTVALTTHTNGKSTTSSKGKNPYTVAPWRLEKKEETITKEGIEWHWCTKDHYSGGEIKNGCYARHRTCDHYSWRKDFDEKKSKGKHPYDKSNESSKYDTAPAVKKLALSETLRTALCTQAGLSSDAADRLWSNACKDSGND